LILDIFAQHATTHEGRLQVELAQYEYRLPRLTRQWTHLARQAGGGAGRGGNGGVGLRGPGETQLEVDRREIGLKITKLKDELEKVRAHRQRQRHQREKTGMPVVALVGYTNAGKSTLMRSLTSDTEIYVANQLFATLDTTTRRVELSNRRDVLLSDTVGFIQKLPHDLIEAFQTTLEGIKEADLILHVVDVTSPYFKQQIETVEDTLYEIETPEIPKILVLNKIDQLDTPLNVEEYKTDEYVGVVAISAVAKIGLDTLLAEIENQFRVMMSQVRLLLPYNKGDIVAWVHKAGIVEAEEHTEEGVYITVSLPTRIATSLQEYTVKS
jgi:GTPase